MANGAAIITGIMPCEDRRLAPQNATGKSHVFAYDAEIYIGVDEDNNIQTALPLLHYFVPASAPEPAADNLAYFVSGKLASIPSDFHVGEGHQHKQYDMLIEAFTMYPDEDRVPIPPTVVLSGVVGETLAKNNFQLDIMQYTLGTTHCTSFNAQNQVGNNHVQKLDIKANSHCALTVTITGEA